MGTRRVRTPAGVRRFDKPIGAVIGGRRYSDPEASITRGGVRRVTVELDREQAPFRSRQTAGQRAVEKRYRVAEADEGYRKMARGEKLSYAERESISYQKPDLREKSKRERGTAIRPRGESLRLHRGRTRASRDVSFNPLSGKFVAKRKIRHIGEAVDPSIDQGKLSRRGRTTAAGARAKARRAPKVPPKTEYVGRRRAKD